MSNSYTVADLIEQLSKCNPEAIVEIELPLDGYGDSRAFTVVVEQFSDPMRMNTMSGWGEDVVYPAFVTLTANEELAHMQPEE
jgi:hypothetical protein